MVKEEEWTCEMWAEGVIDVLILKTPEIADMLKVNYILKNPIRNNDASMKELSTF